jgi:hypothetical protein
VLFNQKHQWCLLAWFVGMVDAGTTLVHLWLTSPSACSLNPIPVFSKPCLHGHCRRRYLPKRCVCVCVCVRERERERERVCVCVYIYTFIYRYPPRCSLSSCGRIWGWRVGEGRRE